MLADGAIKIYIKANFTRAIPQTNSKSHSIPYAKTAHGG